MQNKDIFLFLFDAFFDVESESEKYFVRSPLVFELEEMLCWVWLFNQYFDIYFQ